MLARPDLESRAAGLAVDEFDIPSVCVRHYFDDPKPEPGAVLMGRVASIEHVLFLVVGDTGPVVRDIKTVVESADSDIDIPGISLVVSRGVLTNL